MHVCTHTYTHMHARTQKHTHTAYTYSFFSPWYNHPGWLGMKNQVTYSWSLFHIQWPEFSQGIHQVLNKSLIKTDNNSNKTTFVPDPLCDQKPCSAPCVLPVCGRGRSEETQLSVRVHDWIVTAQPFCAVQITVATDTKHCCTLRNVSFMRTLIDTLI